MMDLKEIIKWFIPCFHILLVKLQKMDRRLTFLILFLFLISIVGAANVNSAVRSETKKNVSDFVSKKFNQSSELVLGHSRNEASGRSVDTSIGRTFGRPFKKMIGALMPLIFQIGAASTWAVVAALVGVKTLVVTLVILKLLLVAGAAKIGALWASKEHHQKPHWEPHQKEIHLHIHNGQHHEVQEEHVPFSPWNREGTSLTQAQPEIKGYVFDPYRAGPQTISTPYGNYVRVDSAIAPAPQNGLPA